MGELVQRYDVYMDNVLQASGLTRDNALIFMNALFEKYYLDEFMITIKQRQGILEESKNEN